MTYIPSTEVLKCNCCSLVRLSRTCPHSLFSGSKLARSGANLMMVLCCFPGEHLKQSVYSLDKYSKKFLPVKAWNISRAALFTSTVPIGVMGSLCGLAARGGKGATSLVHGRFIQPAYLDCMCKQALYLPAWSTLTFNLPLVTYFFFSCKSLILGIQRAIQGVCSWDGAVSHM